MKKSGVFEETYQYYLDQLEAIDLKPRAGILGAEIKSNSLTIPFYNQDYSISLKHGVTGTDNTPVPFAIRVVLLKYILMAPDSSEPDTDPYVTFREFKSAAPLTSFFTVNTNKIIETGFCGRLLHLTNQCRLMGGQIDTGNKSYDLSVSFNALPRIPVQLNFNETHHSDFTDYFFSCCINS